MKADYEIKQAAARLYGACIGSALVNAHYNGYLEGWYECQNSKLRENNPPNQNLFEALQRLFNVSATADEMGEIQNAISMDELNQDK